jgi:uncharacterized cupin superfamily protein
MSWVGKPDVRRALFGGKGSVSVWSLGEGPAPFEVVLGCELAPGSSVGPHVQTDCSELVVVIAGRGRARVDGARVALAAGTLVTLPLGATLELHNTSKRAKLRYVIVKAR